MVFKAEAVVQAEVVHSLLGGPQEVTDLLHPKMVVEKKKKPKKREEIDLTDLMSDVEDEKAGAPSVPMTNIPKARIGSGQPIHWPDQSYQRAGTAGIYPHGRRASPVKVRPPRQQPGSQAYYGQAHRPQRVRIGSGQAQIVNPATGQQQRGSSLAFNWPQPVPQPAH